MTRGRGAGRGSGDAWRALLSLAGLSLALSLSCATAPPRTEGAGTPTEAPRGYRALFRGESEAPGGKERFKVAIALLPPDRLRLEFFGPVGGPRLIVASDGTTVRVLRPADRAFDSAPATIPSMDRLLGLPLDGRQILALLEGRPMCDPDVTEHQVMTKAAVAFGRTLAWYQVTCPPDDIRYEARCEDRGGILRQATVREGISGAMILQVEYGDHEEGLGPRWPRRIRLRMERSRATVTLSALEGPEAGDVPEEVFSPPVPEGFERRSLFVSLAAPGLLGSTAGEER